MTDQSLKLASEFPPADYAAWRALAEAALKGAPFDKKLVTRAADGFDIQPIYSAQTIAPDLADLHGELIAGLKDADDADARGWDIRQLHAHPDPKALNAAILDDLENGATSILLRLDQAARTGGDAGADDAGINGAMIYDLADLKTALAEVYLDLAPISLDGGSASLAVSALICAYLEETQTRNAQIGFGHDPIGSLATEGTSPTDIPAALENAASFARWVAQNHPASTALNVNTTPYYNAGATDGTELAIALATGTTYLRALTEAGMNVAAAAGTIEFTVAIGTDFFAGIAKLRALRVMWQRILSASGAPEADITINAISAEHVLSKVDPWVNMLRTTVTSFAAGLGGANSVICLPYDHVIGLPDGFARRIARNTQLILQEESNVHRVLDPAGGSWFIESLTDQLAKTAWQRFQKFEREGGIASALENGSLATEIDAAWHSRANRLATRRDPLTGVSEFPNLDEKPVTCEAPDIGALRKAAQAKPETCHDEIGTEFADLVSAARKGATIKQLHSALYGRVAQVNGSTKAVQIAPLPAHRLAEAFEELRERADAHKPATGKFPQIFQANIGKVADHTARAMFARNFFGAGGIEAITNNGFGDAHVMADAFGQSGAKIAVICGSDTQYVEHAAAFAQALKAAGASRIYLAGHPGDNRAAFEKAGIDDFIHIGADLVQVCGTVLDHLGVK
jgi:methylmalonyl-CoA mutase